MGWTTARLLRGVQRRISMPLNDVLIGISGVLELADDMIAVHLAPKIVACHEEYFVKILDVDCVEDQAAYDIPDRALGITLRDLKLRFSDAADDVVSLSQVAPEDEHRFRTSARTAGYYLRNDQVVLVPPPTDNTWVIEVWHEQRPSKLTTLPGSATTDAEGDNIDLSAAIESVATDIITCTEIPAGITAATLIDVIRGGGGHRLLGMDLTATAVASPTATLTAGTVPEGTADGDFLAVAGYTPIVQLPDAACVILETLVAKRCTGALADYEARQALADDEEKEIADFLTLISPRNRGEPKKTVSRGGLLRGRRGNFVKRGYYR